MNTIVSSISDLIFTLIAVIPALSVHEYAHGWVSWKLGDPTPKMDGRLSLNPFHHLDPLGTLFLIIFKFGWAKPVMVNPQYYKKPKEGMALVALAGPVSNFIFALVCLVVCNLIAKISGGMVGEVVYYLYEAVMVMALVNVGLGVFNLIPLPPLDGSKVLGAALPEQAYFKFMEFERYGFVVLFLLLYIGTLNKPLILARSLIMDYLNFVAGKLTFFVG